MKGFICELFAFKTLDMEDRVYSTDNQIQKIETSSRDGRDTQFRRPCDDRYLVDTLLLFNTVERGSSVQHKINIYGVTTAYCLSFLTFQTFFYAYFFRKHRLIASDCFSKSSRGKIIEITCHFIIFQTFFLAFKGHQNTFFNLF